MKTINDLKTLQNSALEKMNSSTNSSYRIVVGMATCGIAAGAKNVMNEFLNEIKKRELKDADVSITGCIGVCRLEPIVEVIDKTGKKITYINMSPEKAVTVVAEHIVKGKICSEFMIKE